MEGEARTLKRGELGDAIRRLFREHGVDTTYPRMVELLQSENIAGCSYPTYHDCRREVVRECNGAAANPDALPILDEPKPEPSPKASTDASAAPIGPLDGDSLIAFCKFAALVQEIGGIDRAQRFLSIMGTYFGKNS